MFRIIRAAVAAAALLVLGSGQASAQTAWPDKPVKLVVGFTAGSATDVTARLFAQKFQEAWGQPVVVENVAGNSGAIGTDRVAKATPDGYSLLWGANAALTVLPSLQTLPFDPLKDLTPITTTLVMPSILMVNNDLPVKDNVIIPLISRPRVRGSNLKLVAPLTGWDLDFSALHNWYREA